MPNPAITLYRSNEKMIQRKIPISQVSKVGRAPHLYLPHDLFLYFWHTAFFPLCAPLCLSDRLYIQSHHSVPERVFIYTSSPLRDPIALTAFLPLKASNPTQEKKKRSRRVSWVSYVELEPNDLKHGPKRDSSIAANSAKKERKRKGRKSAANDVETPLL